MIRKSHGYFLATRATGESIACENKDAANSFAGPNGKVEGIPTRSIANDEQVEKLLVIFRLSRREATVFSEEELWDTFVKPNLPVDQQGGDNAPHSNFNPDIQKNLYLFIEDLNLSTRVFNCLRAKGVSRLYEIIETTPQELQKMRNFGKIGMEELRSLLNQKGLSFEMDLTPYLKRE